MFPRGSLRRANGPGKADGNKAAGGGESAQDQNGSWNAYLMTPEHASHTQFCDGSLGALDVVRIAPTAAGHTAVYSDAAEVSPLQVAAAAAVAAHATPRWVFRRGQKALE